LKITSDYEKFMVFVLKERNLTRVTDPDASMIIWPDPDPVPGLNFFINASWISEKTQCLIKS
jgi:hypothetical protein